MRRILCVLVCVILPGCASFDGDALNPLQKIQMEFAYARAESLIESADYLEAGEVLGEAAQDLPPPHHDRTLLKAADAFTRGNHLLHAFRYLKRIDESVLSPSELLGKRVFEAYFYRSAGQPEKVIEALAPEVIGDGGKASRVVAMGLRADALFATRAYIDSVVERIERGRLLEGEKKNANTLDLWRALVAESPENIEDRLLEDEIDRELDAWLQLARLATPARTNRDRLEQEYDAWSRRYSFLDVPADLHGFLRARWDYLDFSPRKVALLLPLTGRYAKQGKAIRDGFMRAHAEAVSAAEAAAWEEVVSAIEVAVDGEAAGIAPPDRETAAPLVPVPQVALYNTDRSASIVKIYRRAVARGADLVVGPLLKPKVGELVEQTRFTVPSIVLNYHLKEDFQPHGELFQFGLLPEDDVVQIAQKMIEKDHRFTLVLTPDSEWGRRLERRFGDEYRKRGGEIREVLRYDLDFSDYSAFVQRALRLDESRRRYRLVEETIGKKAKFNPRIRADITAAVLFSNYEKGVLIYPLIKFFYADDLPVFATSHIYNPAQKKLLRELDGIIYCDIPAVINRPKDEEADGEHPRLLALGADAFHLSGLVRRIGLGNTSFQGLTGRITLHGQRHLFRQLDWARIARGRPVPLGVGW